MRQSGRARRVKQRKSRLVKGVHRTKRGWKEFVGGRSDTTEGNLWQIVKSLTKGETGLHAICADVSIFFKSQLVFSLQSPRAPRAGPESGSSWCDP